MAADEAQKEPTMEEILASIRKIISEDDEPEAASAPDIDDDDVLELHQEDDFDMEPEPEPDPEIIINDFEDDLVAIDPEPEYKPNPAPEPARPSFRVEPERVRESFGEDDKLIEDEAAGSAAGALSRLMGTVSMGSGASLEDVVRELLKPMLKQWLNENLPAIVEAKVEQEVKRISRMAR